LVGVPAVLLTFVGFGALRGLQDMRTPLWISLVISALNIALDPLLIFGAGPLPAFGIAGAAWATTATQWLGAAWALASVTRRLGIDASFEGRQVRALFVVGRDMVIRTGSLLPFLVLATRVATEIGPEAGAAHQGIRQIWMLGAQLLDAYAYAAQSLVGYFLGAGYMGSTLCYMDHSTTPPTPSTVCPAGEDPIQKPEVERRFAAGVHVYVGNDPTLPGYNENYLPLVLAYDFGQGQYKFEADWSLIPVAWKGQRGGMLEREDVLRPYRPVMFGVVPAGSYVITGENFGDVRGHSTVTLSGTELFVKSWSDTEIHVEDPQVPISGPIVVTTLQGPSNALHLDTGYYPPQSVFVDASNTGIQDGSLANPWNSISQALDNLPSATPRYVFVAPGSYNELVQIKESDVRIIGAGPVETIIDGRVATPISTQGPSNGGGPVIFIGRGGETGGVENVMISGFTITGGSVNADGVGAGIFADYGNRNIDINNCVIAHNGGYYGGGIWM
ncbi:MAG: polysaccharide biosynthesis C-terminal domain-containing protein, partial [Candidatus Binatia bacterium]